MLRNIAIVFTIVLINIFIHFAAESIKLSKKIETTSKKFNVHCYIAFFIVMINQTYPKQL